METGEIQSAEATLSPDRPGLFTRRATGLVREVSPTSAAIFNVASAAPGFFAAFSAFFAFSIFPHVNILVVMLLTLPIAVLVAVTFSTLQRVVPRSGGDYVIVSRLLSPPVGVVSTLFMGTAFIMAVGFFAYAFTTVGLQPMFAIMGTVTRSHGLLDAATALTERKWIIIFGLIYVALALVLVAVPMRITMRVQNICMAIAGAGTVLGLLVLWFTSKGTFVEHYNAYAGAGAYEKVAAAGGGASYTFRDTILAVATIAQFTIYQWGTMYFAGEIKQVTRRSYYTMLAPTVLYFAVLFMIVGTLVGKFDHGFLVAANTGASQYTLAAPPFWHFLAAIATGSNVIAIIIAVSFVFWLPIFAAVQLLPPIRSLFAMAFDGILPEATAKVSARTGIPWVAVIVVGALSTVATLFAVTTDNFFLVAIYAGVLVNSTMLIMCIAAMVLPYRHRELWSGGPLSGRVLGVPIISALGGLTFVGVAYVTYLFLLPEYGVPSAGAAAVRVLVVALAGVALYYSALYVQRRRGRDISLNYQEIPPE